MKPVVILAALLGAVSVACSCGSDRAGSQDVADIPDGTDAADAADSADPADAADSADPADTRDVADTADTTADTTSAPDTSDDTADTADASDVPGPPPCPWEDWSTGLDGGRVDAVAFDPRTPGVAWSLSGGLLFRSADDGVTWDVWAEDVGGSFILFPPDEPKQLMLAGSGLDVSYDGGHTFEPLSLGGLEVTGAMIDPAVVQRLWVGTQALGILRSDDRGGSFNARNNGVGLTRVLSFAGFPDEPDLVLAGTVDLDAQLGVTNAGRVLRSTNGGASWTPVINDARWANDFAVCPSDPDLVYAAVRSGVRRSRDRGLTWEPLPLLAGLDVLEVELSADCQTLWASVYTRGVYRLTDDGNTRDGPMQDGLEVQVSAFAGHLAAHPTNPDLLLVGTHGGIFRSTNGGFTWRRAPAARGINTHRMIAPASEPDRVYAPSWGGGLWTRKAPDPWQRVSTLDADFIYSVSVSADDPSLVVVGASGPSWVSTSATTTWGPALAGYNIFAAHFFSPTHVLVATQVGGLFLSKDGGASWNPANTGLTPWPTQVGTFIDTRAIAVDPRDPERVFVGSNGGGLLLSEDAAASWEVLDNELAGLAIGALFIDPGAPDRMYAVVAGRGVMASEDGGATWVSRNAGLDTALFTAIVVDRPTGDLYVTPVEGAVHRSPDGGRTWQRVGGNCADATDFSALAIVEDADGRALIGTKPGNVVLRRRIDGAP